MWYDPPRGCLALDDAPLERGTADANEMASETLPCVAPMRSRSRFLKRSILLEAPSLTSRTAFSRVRETPSFRTLQSFWESFSQARPTRQLRTGSGKKSPAGLRLRNAKAPTALGMPSILPEDLLLARTRLLLRLRLRRLRRRHKKIPEKSWDFQQIRSSPCRRSKPGSASWPGCFTLTKAAQFARCSE